jgi:hypothetical protein
LKDKTRFDDIEERHVLSDDIEVGQLLEWASSAGETNPDPARPNGYNYPITNITAQSRLVRLSRLWSIAVEATSPDDRQLAAHVRDMLLQHNVDEGDEFRQLFNPTLLLTRRLHDASRQKVSFLSLNVHDRSDETGQAAYDDAIVTIFTRLNAGGRALTKEEITFARIKSNWPAADASLVHLTQAMNDHDAELQLRTDDLVRILSLAWTILEDNGTPLKNRDLLLGERLRQMTLWLEGNWPIINSTLSDVTERLSRAGIRYKVHYRSQNAMALLAIWRLVLAFWSHEKIGGAQQRLVMTRRSDALFDGASVGWFALSQWAGLWSNRTDQVIRDHAQELSRLWADIRTLDEQEAALSRAARLINDWLDRLRDNARTFVLDMRAGRRELVGSEYRLSLELWNYTGPEERVQASKTVLSHEASRRTPTTEVDHVVSWRNWSAAAGTEEEKAIANSIGNCILLAKTFNVAKGTMTLDQWLEQIGTLPGFNSTSWKQALKIDDGLSSHGDLNDRDVFRTVSALILAREEEIKKDLVSFIEHSVVEVD